MVAEGLLVVVVEKTERLAGREPVEGGEDQSVTQTESDLAHVHHRFGDIGGLIGFASPLRAAGQCGPSGEPASSRPRLEHR